MGGQEPPPSPHDTRRAGIVATAIILPVLAGIFVVLRLITRIWIIRKVGWDDYTIVAALAGVTIGCALVMVQVHYGFGVHKDFLHPWSYIEYEKYSYGEWIQTFQTLMFTKLSICFFLLRLPVERRYIRPIQVSIVILIVSNIIITLLWIFQCWPISQAWTKDIDQHSNCMTNAQLLRIIISQAIISIISDFMLSLFPIVILWKVQISVRIKVGLCSLMGLGLITGTLCIIRTVLNWQNVNDDATWKTVPNWHLRSWEVNIGIITACIPTLRPGYRVVTNSISTYYSLRSSSSQSKPTGRRQGYEQTDDTRDKEDKAHLARELTLPGHTAQHYSAMRGAAHTARVEADRGAEVGAGEEELPMQGIKGDLSTMEQGIKKTMWFGAESDADRSSGRDRPE